MNNDRAATIAVTLPGVALIIVIDEYARAGFTPGNCDHMCRYLPT
jgi:hypothetical protein